MAKYKKRKDGRYEAKISIGYDDNGKLIRKTVYGKTILELDDKIADLRYKKKQGLITKSSDMYLRDYAISWLQTYKKTKSINTYNMYNNIIDAHIIPSLGHLKLNQIKRSDIQLAVNDRQSQYRTCEIFRLTIKQIFNAAIEDQLVAITPCNNISLPPKPRHQKRILTELEKKAIRTADFSEREKCFIYLIYFFGLRREESLALMPQDFDFKSMELNINKAVIYNNNNPLLSTTKNSTSDRKLIIPNSCYAFFNNYIKNCNTMYLITGASGSLITKSGYDKMWKSIINKMNKAVTSEAEQKMNQKPISGLTAHIFRHNYATMLYYSNISIKKAAQMMGHKDIKMIMEVYAHLDEEQENVSEKINNLIAL